MGSRRSVVQQETTIKAKYHHNGCSGSCRLASFCPPGNHPKTNTGKNRVLARSPHSSRGEIIKISSKAISPQRDRDRDQSSNDIHIRSSVPYQASYTIFCFAS